MDANEITQVRRLFPYLSKYPVVFDVGSNKGLWTDIVIDIASDIHLFEPNEKLLHYTQVKYDSARNVTYCNMAAWKESHEQIPFYIIADEYSGLSSVYRNHNWDYLGWSQTQVHTTTLDHYADSNNIGLIDIIKIDVEGAEYDVLLGCSRLLRDKRVRFIQVEYSEHYKLSGHTFNQMMNYVGRFGYVAFDHDLKRMDTFTEDYHLDNYIIALAEFTENWNAEFIKNTQGIKARLALEIGCFEGLTSNYICDHILEPGGRLICVDPLEDVYLTGTLSPEDEQLNESLPNFKGQYGRFIRNTKGKPIELVRKTSQEAYEELKDYLFNFIYVDGDHREEVVYQDGMKYFQHLPSGGLMLFDDYGWRDDTKRGIDKFLTDEAHGMEVLVKDYQVLVRKL